MAKRTINRKAKVVEQEDWGRAASRMSGGGPYISSAKAAQVSYRPAQPSPAARPSGNALRSSTGASAGPSVKTVGKTQAQSGPSSYQYKFEKPSSPKVSSQSQSYSPIGNSLTSGTIGGPTQIKSGKPDKIVSGA
jgi:hypothetical protein